MHPLTRAKTRPLTTRSAAAAAALTRPRVTWAPLPLTEMAKAKARATSSSQSQEKEIVSVAAKRRKKRNAACARHEKRRRDEKKEDEESGKPSREVLREWVKKAKITVGEQGEAVGDELEDGASPRVTTWRVQQDLLGGSTSPGHPDLHNIEADRHLSLVEFYSQLTYQVKDRVHSQDGTISFSEAGPLPYWIKIALLKMRGVVERYDKRERMEEVGPYQRYVWDRARIVVDELEEMWCGDIERIWRWEEEEVVKRKEGKGEGEGEREETSVA